MNEIFIVIRFPIYLALVPIVLAFQIVASPFALLLWLGFMTLLTLRLPFALVFAAICNSTKDLEEVMREYREFATAPTEYIPSCIKTHCELFDWFLGKKN
jgi:protein-S-isoprenylcysteine O-methyltransferase Ste14